MPWQRDCKKPSERGCYLHNSHIFRKICKITLKNDMFIMFRLIDREILAFKDDLILLIYAPCAIQQSFDIFCEFQLLISHDRNIYVT